MVTTKYAGEVTNRPFLARRTQTLKGDVPNADPDKDFRLYKEKIKEMIRREKSQTRAVSWALPSWTVHPEIRDLINQ